MHMFNRRNVLGSQDNANEGNLKKSWKTYEDFIKTDQLTAVLRYG
jgi:hypothetical protein